MMAFEEFGKRPDSPSSPADPALIPPALSGCLTKRAPRALSLLCRSGAAMTR